jgi:hypothetical protein
MAVRGAIGGKHTRRRDVLRDILVRCGTTAYANSAAAGRGREAEGGRKPGRYQRSNRTQDLTLLQFTCRVA